MHCNVLSTAVVAAVGLTCKAAFAIGVATVSVSGLPTLLNALAHPRRTRGQGIITVANHISTLDDPLAWGVLPASTFLNPANIRWTLGASEIIFTNPLFSAFFRLGQTLETFRGQGIYQPAVRRAISVLDRGGWVHLYGEGKVNQPRNYPRDPITGIANLPRFKWGVGHMIMETAVPPVIIPMWLTGFDKLMPEGRPRPYKYFPRPGAHLTITFGDPIPPSEIQRALEVLPLTNFRDRGTSMPPRWIGGEISPRQYRDEHGSCHIPDLSPSPSTSPSPETLKVRAEVTRIIQAAVESLGRSVSGDSLSSQSAPPGRGTQHSASEK